MVIIKGEETWARAAPGASTFMFAQSLCLSVCVVGLDMTGIHARSSAVACLVLVACVCVCIYVCSEPRSMVSPCRGGRLDMACGEKKSLDGLLMIDDRRRIMDEEFLCKTPRSSCV